MGSPSPWEEPGGLADEDRSKPPVGRLEEGILGGAGALPEILALAASDESSHITTRSNTQTGEMSPVSAATILLVSDPFLSA